MNILFLSVSKVDSLQQSNIYSDLLRVLAENGNNLYVAVPLERRYRTRKSSHGLPKTSSSAVTSEHVSPLNSNEGGDVHFLKVNTLNIQKTNIIEKGLGTLLLEYQFLKAINKVWGNVMFDLIIYPTPPITFNRVIASIKKRCNARTYLLLKDIFPQNAVDLGMMSENSLFYKIFRRKEERLYELSDKIGCMSPANRDYLLANNADIPANKVEVFPNSIIPQRFDEPTAEERVEVLEALGIDSQKVVSIYGGNIGKPQGVDFLIDVLAENEKRKGHHIVIVGDGTEYGKLQSWFESVKPVNATLKARLPKEEYEGLARVADIGLIFLDHRFTIPNYPSRLLSYLENGIPVMVASDVNTDIGPMAEEEGYGFWCESNDVDAFFEKIESLIGNAAMRREMGRRGRRYLEEALDVRLHIPKIVMEMG